MTLVTFAEPVQIAFQKSAMTTQLVFEAGREYVIAQQHFNHLCQQQGIAQRCFKMSRIENRITNFNVSARKQGSQRLLLYNGSGGYGDQIITWPFAKILFSRGFEVHILSDPGNQMCWWNFPWIKTIQTFPMQYEQWKMYDYHVMMEHVVNVDEHQDQQHPLDVMLNKVGIDPATVDPALKVVRPNFTFLEMQSTIPFHNKTIAMYQLSAANPVRCLPPNDSAFLLTKIADAYPHIHWLALYDQFNNDTYRKTLVCPKCEGQGQITVDVPFVPPPGAVRECVNAEGTVTGYVGTCVGNVAPEAGPAMAIAQVAQAEAEGKVVTQPAGPTKEPCPKCKGSGTLRPNIQLYMAPSLRELWALATRAKVIVAPDSLMVHVAGCMDIPCVGLWGLTAPGNRVRYYKNHAPVWKREACPFSPCFGYAGTFPKYCPPRPNRAVCEVLGAIAPQDVIDQIKNFIPLPS